MHLTRISGTHFRNLAPFQLDTHRRLNVFTGDNGHGKTNLLEAVHLVAALRPLRSVERGRDLIRFNEASAVVGARFDLDGPLDVDIEIEPKGRRARIAGKVVRDVSEIASRIHVVAFTPEDLTIVRGGPGDRRRALDRFAFSLLDGFGGVARRYEQTLERRNRLLRMKGPDNPETEAYTTTLVETGVSLLRARLEAVDAWSARFSDAVLSLSNGELDARLTYKSSFAENPSALSDDALSARFDEKLTLSRDQEFRRQQTATGPHLDDMVLTLDDHKARHFASQGEARALVLALKIAAVRALHERHGTAPLLLLDDVAGELDPARARLLFQLIDDVDTQAFVTATHRAILHEPGEGAFFSLKDGAIAARA